MPSRHLQPLLSRLYPDPCEVSLQGLYLDQDLYQSAVRRDTPFVFSNFVSSIDGRIALETGNRATRTVPDTIANPRDWRLYQELAGQADILITSGRFFRQSACGEAQDMLPVSSHADFEDIRHWRVSRGLTPQPDIAILSSTLDIPLDALSPYRSRKIRVLTGEAAATARVQQLEHAGIEVFAAGPAQQVDGRRMVDLLGTLGYRSLYAIAGPAVLHTLINAGRFDRLYLTIACRLLGGQAFDTLLRGTQLVPAPVLRLRTLYHDPAGPDGSSQLFCIFDTLHTQPEG